MKCLKKYGQKVKFDLIGLENDKSFRRPPVFKMQEHNPLFGKGNAVREKMNKYRYFALVTASALALGGCDKISSFFGGGSKSEEFVQRIEPSKDDGSVGMLLPDFAQLVQNEGQAVVNIQASPARRPAGSGQSEEQGMDLSQFPDNDPFYEFFKRLVPNMPDMPEDQSADEDLNFGSGFIISKDGYILTNTHVVAGMGNIKVLLNDKREYTAKLIGSDTQSDVALLKIDASEELPVVKIGNPKDLKPGEWVAAIGAPFGFDNSVTSGIVSAKGRSLPNESYTPFIQTDVAINPGNSGGPLFNLKGQVVGINSQIYSRSGGFMGISFAIPIDVAMNVAEQLKTSGKVQRGQLGVIIQEVSYDLAKSFGLDKASGALIAKVMPNSPAMQAGLQVGDIVRSVNGEEVRLVKSRDKDLRASFGYHVYAMNTFLHAETDTVVRTDLGYFNIKISVATTSDKIIKSTYNENGIEVDNAYLDNAASLVISNQKQTVYSHEFRKQEFASLIDKAFLEKSILRRFEFNHADAKALYFDAVIGIPDASTSYVIAVKITADGKLAMKMR